jgi:hypothetical protein
VSWLPYAHVLRILDAYLYEGPKVSPAVAVVAVAVAAAVTVVKGLWASTVASGAAVPCSSESRAVGRETPLVLLHASCL